METRKKPTLRSLSKKALPGKTRVLSSKAFVSNAERLKVATDSDVVALFLGGEERAFEELVERYKKRLLNFIYRSIGDFERSEDLVQETFIRVYRHLHRFDRSKKFCTWIYTIASNLAKNELRNRSRNPVISFASLRTSNTREHEEIQIQFEDVRHGPERLIRERELQALVEYGIAQMSTAHYREVFVLRELEGKSYEEIAQITHINLGTVKSRLNRARSAFARIIGPYLA